MDGVIADSEPLHARAWVEALLEHGVPTTVRWFDRWIGISDTEAADELVKIFGLGVAPSTLLRRRQALFQRIIETDLAPLDGLESALDRLEAPMAVATSSYRDDVVRMLRKIGLLGRLPVLVTREDVARPKPAPEVYLTAAARLGVAPARCVAIEDSPAGIASGREAGCLVLGVSTTHEERALEDAFRVFPRTVDALQWLLSTGTLPAAGARD
jgi:HAD superfamily hydrolase (TIGR01509 family)